jgi:hypothetical protein
MLFGGFVIGPILLTLGMLGFSARFREGIGTVGKAMLLIGVFGGAVSLVGGAGQWIGGDSDSLFTVYMIGLMVLFGCLVPFGVMTLIQKPFPRWNGLPLVAGLWIFVGFFGSQIEKLTAVSLVGVVSTLFFASIFLSGAAVVFLGILVLSDQDKLAGVQ